MSNPLFDNAPEYDSDLDTLADFVIEPTTAHVPPPPSPAPNTCLCGRTTRDDDSDEPLYCSETCARLDAFHALTARSRSNSLAPTPITTAPATPLFPHAILRESLAGFFSRPDSTNTPVSTPLSATSSFASVDNVPLPIEMSSHYRRVTAKRERMEWERSRSHSRTHSRARPSLSELEEEHQVETHIERENGSDGEDFVPAFTSVHVHVAVDVQVVQNCAQADALDADQLSDALSASMLDPAPGVSWHDPFADPADSPTRATSIAPDSHEHHPLSDAFSITESVEDFSPFNTYAPTIAPPSVLPSRKSSVCFAGVGPAGRILSAARSRAQSDARQSPVCELSEKPLPPPPVDVPSLESKEVPETPIESPAVPSETPSDPSSSEGPGALPSPGLTLDLPSPMPSFDMTPGPYTPTSSSAPESPCTPNGRSSASPSRTSVETPKRSPPVSSRPAPSRPATSPQRRAPRRFQTLDSVPRATIFSMVLDPEFDVTSGNPSGPGSASAQLKRVDTAPELNMGRDSGFHTPAGSASISPETPHKQRTRARATSTPRRPADALRQRTSSTPMHPGMLQLATKAPRRGRLYAPPPPTPPVSPSDVSSPRPPDPGTWQSFGAAFDALGWNPGMSEDAYQSAMDEQGLGFHRRQESGESTGSSATDASWSSSYGAPPSNSSVYSWPAISGATAETDNDAYAHLRARSPAASSVRTIVPPPRGSSLIPEGDGPMDHMHLHLGHSHRSRRQSSIAALDSILAMEDTFWADPILVRDAEDSMESEGMSPGVQFGGDANGFAFPATKDKPMFEPTLRIAGLSRPPSAANMRNPNSDNSGLRVRRQSSAAKSEYLAPPTLDQHAHRTSASNFPVSPSIASARPSPEVDVAASPMLTHLSTSLFDGPFTSSPVIGTPALSRGSPALPNGSPISAHFSLRTPSSPYLSVPSGLSRRTSRSTDASSVLLRTASAARLAAALNAAPEDEDEEALRRGREDASFARYSPGMGHRANRSGSLGRSGSAGSSSAMGLGLALGGIVEHDSRARSSSEPWAGIIPGSAVTSGNMSRSGSRMNLMDPSVLAVPEEEEEEEDYGQVVPASKFSGIAVSPTVPSMEDTGEASPLIDAFPHPMGGYFPGSRYASRANTPVKGLHTSNSALSLRQVAMGNASQENAQNVAGREDSGDEEEIVTTVQRMRHSMQLLATA